MVSVPWQLEAMEAFKAFIEGPSGKKSFGKKEVKKWELKFREKGKSGKVKSGRWERKNKKMEKNEKGTRRRNRVFPFYGIGSTSRRGRAFGACWLCSA